MKKLKLIDLQQGAGDVLKREQLKHIIGGSITPSWCPDECTVGDPCTADGKNGKCSELVCDNKKIGICRIKNGDH